VKQPPKGEEREAEASAEKYGTGDMTPEEREEVEKEAEVNRRMREEVWNWIGILVIAAGIMFLICSMVTFITWRWSQRS
jgi:hypothetical protein